MWDSLATFQLLSLWPYATPRPSHLAGWTKDPCALHLLRSAPQRNYPSIPTSLVSLLYPLLLQRARAASPRWPPCSPSSWSVPWPHALQASASNMSFALASSWTAQLSLHLAPKLSHSLQWEHWRTHEVSLKKAPPPLNSPPLPLVPPPPLLPFNLLNGCHCHHLWCWLIGFLASSLGRSLSFRGNCLSFLWCPFCGLVGLEGRWILTFTLRWWHQCLLRRWLGSLVGHHHFFLRISSLPPCIFEIHITTTTWGGRPQGNHLGFKSGSTLNHDFLTHCGFFLGRFSRAWAPCTFTLRFSPLLGF